MTMRRQFVLLYIFILFTGTVHCQIPEKFHFQLIARDANGNIYSEKKIEIKVNIVETEHNGYAPYIEKHIITTTNTGLANIIIGGGIVEKGSLKDIDWFNKANFVEIWINNNFTSSVQMVAVPYAIAVKKAISVGSANYLDIKNRPRIPTDVEDLTDQNNLLFDGDYQKLTNRPSTFDGDYTNLSNKPLIPTDLGHLTDNTFMLANVDYTKIKNQPTLFDGNYESLSNKPNIPTDINQLTDINNKLFSGDYNDLIDKPDINQDFNGDYNQLIGTPTIYTDLSTIPDANEIWKKINFEKIQNKPDLFDGSFLSLTNVPDNLIPRDIEDLTDNTGKLFDRKFSSLTANVPTGLFSGKYEDLHNKPTIKSDFSHFTELNDGIKVPYNDLLNLPLIPSKLSDLEQDINYLITEDDDDIENELQNLSSVISKGTSAGYKSITNIGNPLANADAATKEYAATLLNEITQMESTLNDIAPRTPVNDMKTNGATIQEMLDEGYTVEELLSNSITIAECKAGGVTLYDLLVGGADAGNLYSAGFSATDIIAEGINPELLKNAGVSINELFNAGVDVNTLYKIGFTLEQILSLNTSLNNLSGTVNDSEGNTYKWKGIGNDIWFIDNLKATRFNNGDNITTTHVYNNNSYLLTHCGRMYVGTDIISGKNVCPSGWKVPSNNDYIKMKEYLRTDMGVDESTIGQAVKSDSRLWLNNKGTNISGFNAEPYGYFSNNKYVEFSRYAAFWTSTPYDSNNINIMKLWYASFAILFENSPKSTAAYVRCIKER